MIGLIVDAGIASWNTAGLSNASGRYWHRVRQALVAIRVAPRAVDLLPRAGRHRTGQGLDAAARDIDDRHRRHAHHRSFEQGLADRPVLVLRALISSARHTSWRPV
jgi:hypothetical protein